MLFFWGVFIRTELLNEGNIMLPLRGDSNWLLPAGEFFGEIIHPHIGFHPSSDFTKMLLHAACPSKGAG